MAGQRRSSLPASLNVMGEGVRHLITKIDYHLVAALPGDGDPVVFKVYILNIQTHTFGHTDPGSQQKSQDGQIPVLRLPVISQGLSGQLFPGRLYKVQKHGHLVRIQPDNGLLMELWHGYQQSGILRDRLALKIIIVEASQRRHLAGQAFFPVSQKFLIVLIYLQIFHIFLDIHRFQPFQVLNLELIHGIVLINRIVLHEKMKKDPDIISIIDPRPYR